MIMFVCLAPHFLPEKNDNTWPSMLCGEEEAASRCPWLFRPSALITEARDNSPERTRWHNDIVFANHANTCGYSKPLSGRFMATLVRSSSWSFGGGDNSRLSEQRRAANKF
jgi:hypothetical protein